MNMTLKYGYAFVQGELWSLVNIVMGEITEDDRPYLT